jgi:hypothetical protein
VVVVVELFVVKHFDQVKGMAEAPMEWKEVNGPEETLCLRRQVLKTCQWQWAMGGFVG